jgi:hypothetical protein
MFSHRAGLQKPLSRDSFNNFGSPLSILRNNFNLTDQNDSDGSIYGLCSEGSLLESRPGHHYLDAFSGFLQRFQKHLKFLFFFFALC